jgi:hypothetical protein
LAFPFTPSRKTLPERLPVLGLQQSQFRIRWSYTGSIRAIPARIELYQLQWSYPGLSDNSRTTLGQFMTCGASSASRRTSSTKNLFLVKKFREVGDSFFFVS